MIAPLLMWQAIKVEERSGSQSFSLSLALSSFYIPLVSSLFLVSFSLQIPLPLQTGCSSLVSCSPGVMWRLRGSPSLLPLLLLRGGILNHLIYFNAIHSSRGFKHGERLGPLKPGFSPPCGFQLKWRTSTFHVETPRRGSVSNS